MQALVFQNGKVRLEKNYPDPKPEADEVLIAVKKAGVCSTDLEILLGYMGFTGVMGHEFVGRVVKGPKDLQGKRVVGEINCVCGRCDMCLSGLSPHCRTRQVVGIKEHEGVFAELVTLPVRNVHALPDTVNDEEAVFVEPLAAAMQIIKQVPNDPRAKTVVVGDGRLGLLVVQVLAAAAAGGKGKVILVGKHPEKLSFADKRGIQTMVLDEILLKPEWDVVVDCTGKAEGFATCCALVRPRGKFILKSTFAPGQVIDLSPLVINEVTLVGSRCGPFPEAINALAADRIVTNGLITSRFKLTDGINALEKAQDSRQIKVLLEVGE